AAETVVSWRAGSGAQAGALPRRPDAIIPPPRRGKPARRQPRQPREEMSAMSVLVALVREAQPGRVAEVRQALSEHAQKSTLRHSGIRTYQLLQGRAQSNLYIDLVEWDSRRSFDSAQESLRSAVEEIGHLFLRPV